jgi:hypothetical protein
MTVCILCSYDFMGKPTVTTEGEMCPDSAGCRRRAYRLFVNDGICEAHVGLGDYAARCQLERGHEGNHTHGTTVWNDQVPVKT